MLLTSPFPFSLQIATEDHWDDICLLIAVVSDAKKETGSTDGMVRSVNTSALLKYRAETVVDERLDRIKKAYLEKDFATFAEISMQDSNQFHACCMDTFPPIFYMNDVSKRIISILHKINAEAGRTIGTFPYYLQYIYPFVYSRSVSSHPSPPLQLVTPSTPARMLSLSPLRSTLPMSFPCYLPTFPLRKLLSTYSGSEANPSASADLFTSPFSLQDLLHWFQLPWLVRCCRQKHLQLARRLGLRPCPSCPWQGEARLCHHCRYVMFPLPRLYFHPSLCSFPLYVSLSSLH